jgi:IPTL-CTERM motif
MEKQMSINRLLLVLLAALLLPGLALAQSRATFAVTKDFSDGNNVATATVTLNCNTGLPLSQTASIKDTGGVGVTFILESYGEGTNCAVTETAVAGYNLKPLTGYVAGGTGAAVDGASNATGCTFTGVGNGDAKTCLITNNPTPVGVTVNKKWVIDGEGGDQIDPTYSITLNCGSSEIVGGTLVGANWTRVFSGNSTADKSFSANVVPKWNAPFSACNATEFVPDSSIEHSGDCTALGGALHPVLGGGGDNSCTITNTVFFEGIPTLSQYGMAIMALLMLGVGFVGFRRFV